MATDWAADVKRYVANADDEVIAGIVRYCGIALQKRDSSLVSFSDPVETGRVRENFLKKKLGLSNSDAELDTIIAEVGLQMKGDNFKNRVTVYYLLADRFGMHHLFRKGGSAGAAGGGEAAAAAVAAGAALGSHANDGDAAAPAAPAGLTSTPPGGNGTERNRDTGAARSERKSGAAWLWWLLGLLLLLLLLWWLFLRHPAGTDQTDATSVAAVAPTNAGAPTHAAATATGSDSTDLAAAPAEGTVQIPTGAGVTAETRAGKPVVKVYFATGKSDVAPAFTAAAGGLKTWLGSHAGSSLAISGYTDKTGNAAINAALSKSRAQAVQKALVAAGIPEASTELVKPTEATDTSTDNAAARRVEVVAR